MADINFENHFEILDSASIFNSDLSRNISLNSTIKMFFNIKIKKIYPWIGIIGSLCLIIPSALSIKNNPFEFTTDHLIFAAGIVLLVVFTKEFFNSSNKTKK